MKKTNGIKLWGALNAMLLTLATFFTGCGGSAGIAQPGTQPSTPMGSDFYIPTDAVAQLNVRMVARASGDASDSLAQDVGDAVSAKLNAQGFEVTSRLADLQIDLNIGSELFDKSGSYYLYRGTVKGSVIRTSDSKVVANKIMTAKGTRSLGEAQAIDSLSDSLAEDTASWVVRSVTFEAIGLAATDINVTAPFGSNLASYAQRFVREVNVLQGVASCNLIAENAKARTMTFRTVYYARSFPEGILNRIYTISDLNLKRR